MALIAERLSITVEYIRAELKSAVGQLATYVETLERTPGQIHAGTLDEIMNYTQTCLGSMQELAKYGAFFGDIADTIVDTDNLIETFADRYLDRARLPGLPMSTAQAMEHFSRSRSTIYRWIKSGKIKAEKHGRRWTVFV